MKGASFLLLLFFLIHLSLVAQDASFTFHTTKDGLKGNNTSTVTQDKQGFLWFVNDGVIHRYDGRNYVQLLPPPQFQAEVESLVGLFVWQDSLIFTWGQNNPILINPRTNQWELIPISATDPNLEFDFFQRLAKGSNLITSSLKDNSKFRIWEFQGDSLVNIPTYHFPYLEEKSFWADMDGNKRLYLAYGETLFKTEKNGEVESIIPLQSICDSCINLNFQFGADSSFVLLVNWQFYIWDKEKNTFIPHPANRFLQRDNPSLHRFILRKDGSIWACGHNRNLIYYDAEQDTLYNYHDELKSIIPNQVDFKDLYQDHSGSVWIETRLGLLKVKRQSFPFNKILHKKDDDGKYYSFRGFAEDAQGTMYGMYYSGLSIFNPKTGQQKLFPITQPISLFDLHIEKNQLWLNGREWYNIQSEKLEEAPFKNEDYPFHDNGFFATDINGTSWWLVHYDLFYLDQKGDQPKWVKAWTLPDKDINRTEALFASPEQEALWISYQGKLVRFRPGSSESKWFNPHDWGLPISRILAIEAGTNGTLWLATDIGLFLFSPEQGFIKSYNVDDGLPNDFICGMLMEGDSALWLSTNNGLSRFSISGAIFLNFYTEDGLTHNEFNRKSYFKSRDGRMYFGGLRGINAFYPTEIMNAYRNRTQQANMVLSSLEYIDERKDSLIRKTAINQEKEIHFYHWDWSYQFEYAFTDYSNSEELFYSYRMKGYKDSWSRPSKFNFARFNSLPQGTYYFQVKVRDSSGHWHPNELSFKVVVHPPWWASWWAYAIYTLLFLLLIWGAFQFYSRRLKLKNQLQLEAEEAHRLKELDQFKTRLYTNLTHEFRTPLTVILGMIDQIDKNPVSNLQEGVPLIRRNSKNLLRLINQLLDLSKLENKSFNLQLQSGNILPFLRYLTESFQTFANSHNLSLRFFSSVEQVIMDHDPEQLKQVMSNLISNAVKFTPSEGEVSVHVAANEQELQVEVRDTGIGISEENLAHVFDRFYQVDSETTRAREGTGIGLAHSQELVKTMGGNIRVESELGKGSSFFIHLPIRREIKTLPGAAEQNWTLPYAIPEIVPLAQPVTTSATPQQDLPQLLIIEDNPDVVIYLKKVLEPHFQLSIAYNGKIGIDKAFETIPDIIISDVMMPEKDGYEVCDTLKNDDRTSHIPLILLTAKVDAASRISGLRRGADAYLAKPFDKEELLVRLEKLLEGRMKMRAYFASQSTPTLPEAETEAEVIQVEHVFIQKVRALLEEHISDPEFALPQLCEMLGMSRSVLFRKMKALTDTSPSAYIRSYRLQKAKELLENPELNISDIAWEVGFKDLSHFSKLFQTEFGIRPTSLRKKS